MDKQYISPQQLLADAFALAAAVFSSGYRPSCVVGVWRGGTPVAIAIHELLRVLGVETDHAVIRTSSYLGIGQRDQSIRVDGLEYLVDRLGRNDRLLLVDDVYDTGLSLQQVVIELERASGAQIPEVRIATPWFKPGNNRSGRNPDYFLHQTADWLVFPHELEGLSLEEMRANKPELAAVLPLLAGKTG